MNPKGSGTKRTYFRKMAFCLLISESDARGSPSPYTFGTVSLFGISPSVSPLRSVRQKKSLSSSLLSMFENWEWLLSALVPRGEFRNWRAHRSLLTGGLFTRPDMAPILKSQQVRQKTQLIPHFTALMLCA